MILQSLAAYYERRGRDPDPARRLPPFGFAIRPVPIVVEIDRAGALVVLRDTREVQGKKRIAREFLLPIGEKKAGIGAIANLLWDTAEYALGRGAKGAAFIARVEALAELAPADKGLAALLKFLRALPVAALERQPLWTETVEDNLVLTYQLHEDTQLIAERPAVVAAIERSASTVDSAMVQCLVTGEQAPLARVHNNIKGVWGAQTSGANIVSFNLDAFRSYGKDQGANAPVGEPAAFAYTTALNDLLARDSRNRMQVGDASTVIWAAERDDLATAVVDIFGEPPKDDPGRNVDAARKLLAAVETGRKGDADDTFYILGLAPNASRIAIRFWIVAPLPELAPRVERWLLDTRIVHRDYEPEQLSLFRLLLSVALLAKADNIPPNLGGDVVRAVLSSESTPLPALLLNAAIERTRARHTDAERALDHARAATIKVALNRAIRFRNLSSSDPEQEFPVSLDPDRSDPAYRLGRLFAALEKIQEEAQPGINATIRDRYYGAASSTPVAVFTTLLRLHKHHLAKLSVARRTWFEKLVGYIMDGLGDFPRQLDLADQGRFAIGYYHQRQAFFTKSTDTSTKE